jgi:tetratricopeptide (TPR) repeat protein
MARKSAGKSGGERRQNQAAPSDLLPQAVQLHQAGRLQDAEKLYRRILRADPGHADANHLLGLVIRAGGQLELAAELVSKAVAASPQNPVFHGNLGNLMNELGRTGDAIYSLKQSIALRPDNAVTQSNLGNILLADERLEEALDCYDQALILKADFIDVIRNRAGLLQTLERFDDAAQGYRNALVLNPGDAAAHNNLGTVLFEQGKLDEAVASYRAATDIDPEYALALNNLGVALNELGHAQEAAESCRRALAVEPDNGEAHRNVAYFIKHENRDDDVRAMEASYSNSEQDAQNRMHLGFALAKVFEDGKKYDEAFGYLAEANAARRASYSYSSMVEMDKAESIKKLFDADLFEKFRGAGNPDETPIFILGMPRSGTTLAEQILSSHPQVFGAGELSILSRTIAASFGRMGSPELAAALGKASASELGEAGKKYLDALRRRFGETRFISDKMPGNFLNIGMIKLMLPKAKVIHCRRGPEDTCLSIFKTYFSVQGMYYAYDLTELGEYFQMYEDLMAHWMQVLPGFAHDFCYEDLVDDQEGLTRSLLAYCGLEWDDACLRFHESERAVRTASAGQVRSPIYRDSIGAWKRYEKNLSPLIEALS